MGFEATRQSLTLQASRVILAVRSKSKGQEAISALRADPSVKTANPKATIEAFDLDLDGHESGRRFAQKVKQEVKELDILLCNGGVNIMKYQTSRSGHESHARSVESEREWSGLDSVGFRMGRLFAEGPSK
jgi:NAD(P)-dependent dehydrogenase (short-subunit alcohol dehydrogenase family)